MIAAPAVIDEQIAMLERAGCEVLVAEEPPRNWKLPNHPKVLATPTKKLY